MTAKPPIGFNAHIAPAKPDAAASQTPVQDDVLPRPTNPLHGSMALSRLCRTFNNMSDVERSRIFNGNR